MGERGLTGGCEARDYGQPSRKTNEDWDVRVIRQATEPAEELRGRLVMNPGATEDDVPRT